MLLVVVATVAIENQEEDRVLVLQESGTPSAASYARLVKPFPRLESFTICYRIKLNRFREESTLMSYAVSDDKDNEFRIDHRESGYRVTIQGYWAASQLVTPLRSWAHFCFLYQLNDASWTIYLNGERRAEGSFPGPTTPLEGGGAFVIGQEQDSLGGGFQRDQSFCGEITHLNIWSRTLDHHTLTQVWSCEGGQPGDLLSWSSSLESWQIDGETSWVQRSRHDLCHPTTRIITIFPDRFNLAQADHLCHVSVLYLF
ncbi:Neuronal pentraxin-2-like 8 [Homarus americanus]|uniref:Neuronal pentraxin-2-like 8 n=1 Tax=Homarus americanus TaxID=6706 RepID=A0A8J5JXE5_HOMAM|nr:Neuronal pentraxin-2-like 8 [Homarus americanus]